ncbi:MAG TPA: NADH-quinone oxidoreductase subunit J [Firmicutes bacterium]|nr:NADH-quinone oxidoreductase subunit J [Bacillota bacterium]
MKLAFVLISALTLAAALGVVVSRRVMPAALLIGLCFLGVAGLYATLGQGFLAVVQVLIYVGAMTTMFLFAIMLSEREEITGRREGQREGTREPERHRTNRPLFSGRVLPFLASLGLVGLLWTYLAGQGAVPAATVKAPGPAHSAREIARLLFGEYLVPFEITSVILLAGLIGALVLARGGEER